ncbi:MAG: DMT family transporter, partial [Gemmatimonadetes bacterium]|nr:DMT family transporter [Gemmatimonadota bacterium]
VLLGAIAPGAWAYFRLTAAAAILLTVWVLRRGAGVAPGDLARLAGFAFFGVVLNQICFIEGLSRTTPAHSALINTTIPVLTILFAVVLGKERLRRATAMGILLAMAGVLVLLQLDDLEWRAEWFAGDLLTQLNAASFSFFLVISKDTIRRVGSFPSTVAILCFGSLGVALYGGRDAAAFDPAVFTPGLWAIAAYIVLFPTVFAYFLNYWALARVESSQVALFVYLQPILAATLSVMFLGEEITGRLLVSSGLVFLGVLFATRDLGGSSAPRGPSGRGGA